MYVKVLTVWLEKIIDVKICVGQCSFRKGGFVDLATKRKYCVKPCLAKGDVIMLSESTEGGHESSIQYYSIIMW